MDKVKIKGAWRFEGHYYLPRAENVLAPSVTPKERILIVKIHLTEPF